MAAKAKKVDLPDFDSMTHEEVVAYAKAAALASARSGRTPVPTSKPAALSAEEAEAANGYASLGSSGLSVPYALVDGADRIDVVVVVDGTVAATFEGCRLHKYSARNPNPKKGENPWSKGLPDGDAVKRPTVVGWRSKIVGGESTVGDVDRDAVKARLTAIRAWDKAYPSDTVDPYMNVDAIEADRYARAKAAESK